ncbi:hypothetical protein BGX27_000916 [Mortierella sp. AM989]|nr:hypothetical protein BGX27_000916 [Mortierella sp. AM989]
MVYTAVLANADPAHLCTGALSCDAGFCCSSSGFCGRSAFHCSHSSGCNSEKGSCGIVLLDKQDLPHVIAYDQLSQTSMGDLVKKLTDDGSHLTPEDKSKNMTIDSFLQSGLADKQLIQPQQATKPTPAAPNPVPADTVLKPVIQDTAAKVPSNTPESSTKPTSNASKMSVGGMGAIVLSVLGLIL